jgi:hypothetical protein
MAMDSNELATKIAKGMKDDGLFNIPILGGGSEFNQDSYDSTLAHLKRDWGEIIEYLKSNMEVVNVTTDVSTTVTTTGSASAQTGTGKGTGSQSNKGSVQ